MKFLKSSNNRQRLRNPQQPVQDENEPPVPLEIKSVAPGSELFDSIQV